jgi:hypothetical protein
MALAYLAPLPIMIATLGWGLDAGVVSLGVASAVVAGFIDPLSGLLFALTVALPSWGLAAFASAPTLRLFSRTPPATPAVGPTVGAIVLVAACAGVLISVGALVSMIVVYGGYQKGVESFSKMLEPVIQESLGGALNLPDEISLTDIVRLIVKYSPPAIAASTTLMFCANLYAAARSAQLSQTLKRPWPDVPRALVLPPWLGAVALAALIVWLAAPEPPSQFAAILVGGLGVAYVLQGLAVLHALSRRLPGRPALIAALYLACFVAPKWVLPLVAAIGLVESVAMLRKRAAARPSRP